MPNAPGHDAQHAQHDPLLVAALAAGDLAADERDRATGQVRDCTDCRALHDDLLAIARATAALPAAVRPRDFRLSDEQAARLRGSAWRRLVGAIASPRLAFTRQLGVGLTTLGIAGLLISALPAFPLAVGGAASAPMAAPEAMSSDTASEGDPAFGGAQAASPAPSAALAPVASAPAATGLPVYGADGSAAPSASGMQDRATDRVIAQAPGETPGRDTTRGDGGADERLEGNIGSAETGSVPLLLLGSAIALVAGIVLLVTRRLAAR